MPKIKLIHVFRKQRFLSEFESGWSLLVDARLSPCLRTSPEKVFGLAADGELCQLPWGAVRCAEADEAGNRTRAKPQE